MEESIQDLCERLRAKLRDLEIEARGIKDHSAFKSVGEAYKGQNGEMIAQSMLAVRAMEESRMRLGKVLQYAGNGISIFDLA